MTNKEMGARLEMLEVRYAHQESALEELTRTLLNQEQQVRTLMKLTERLEAQLSAQASPGTDASGQEPPPHY